MNSISKLIATQDADYVLLNGNSRRDLVFSVALYMFRIIDSPTLSKEFKSVLEWKGQDCIDFRKMLKSSGQIQRDLKLYMYAKIVGEPAALEGLKVSDADKKLVESILRSKNEKAVKLIKRCRYYARTGYKPKSLAVLNIAMDKVTRELDAYCKKFVNKKFLFLTQSGQMGKEDIYQDFIEVGVYAIYKAYPIIKTRLHMLNIAKNAIHNLGMNIIKEQTTSSRMRVVKHSDGTFSGNLVSLGQLITTDHIPDMGYGPTLVANGLVTGLDGRSVNGEQFCDVNRGRDLEQTVEHVYSSLTSSLQKRFVNLLMGTFDSKFTDWLGQPNDDFCTKVDRKVYANKVREYLQVPIPRAKALVAHLREQLKDFRN